jgi:curved DNA-binding protein
LDYYRVLGVESSASAVDLKKAYRQLAIAWHPDRNPGSPLAEERFKAISEAYAVLSDPIKRRSYDQLGPDKFSSEYGERDIFQGFEVADLFKEFGLPDAEEELKRILAKKTGPNRDPQVWQDFFSGFGQKPGPRIRTAPVTVTLAISLREAVYGAEKTVALNTPVGPVKTLVLIPQGAIQGQKITLKGQGPPAGLGQKPTDLALTLNILPDPDFNRRGDDLLTTVDVTPKDLKYGCQPMIKTLDDRGLRLTIKPGSHPGLTLRAAGYGVPTTNGALLIRLRLKK